MKRGRHYNKIKQKEYGRLSDYVEGLLKEKEEEA
jgi:hypothetical protein